MMTRKHFYTLLITCLALLSCVTAKAGDKTWTLNADKTEWLYTYTTEKHPFVDKYGYQLYAVGQITFSFRNTIDANQKINDRWTDYRMRIGNPDGFNSSGRVSVKAYYASTNSLAYDNATDYYNFVYYNSDIDDNGILKISNEWVINKGFWWDMDTQSSIKLFFQRVGGGNVEILRIPRPDDTGATCYSTTENIQRHYRTNLYNRYDANHRHLSKGVMYMKDHGDGTYLFNPVWDQFIKTSGTQTIAKNQYKQNALGWTGKVSSDKVVVAPLNTKTGKYELSIDVLIPLTKFEDKGNKELHSLFQAIVRADQGTKINMAISHYDYEANKFETTTWDYGFVSGVGIDDNKTNNKAYGTVYPTGRVDFLKRVANGGWLKLEFPIKVNNKTPNVSDLETQGKLILTADKPFEVSDIFLLWRPNQPGFYQTSATTGPNALGDSNINKSWVDLSTETKFSLFDRGDNLNRVVKVGPNSPLGMAGREHPCNVVVNGKMPLLYLTDRGVFVETPNKERVNTGVWKDKDKKQYMESGYTFGVKEGFTADKVWFDRNFARRKDANGKYHSMSTICLPFAMNATELSKFNVSKAYEFVNATGNTATFKEVTKTEADTPYLIEPTTAITTANEKPIEFGKKDIPASNIATGDFIGTYKYNNLKAKDGEYTNYIFGFNTQKFNYVKSSGASFKPFRAYLRSKQPAGSLAKSIEFKIWDGSVTGIEQIDAKDNTPSHAPIYTIDGRMVSPTGNLQLLPQGIYIQNGKKIIK
ncbi:hypothetical protein BFS16_03015 [Hoylesella timonensis]|uniref:Uncharacterized protein n=1 Tax=Hoylesella timonensis TaxID=386414 RepID=A0A2K0XNA9_9BACT|nr:hypothetical protein [Hoylesella timonensis]PNP96029.1 hypothetical protein BFS16_03015 [Hoylesella timonensis]